MYNQAMPKRSSKKKKDVNELAKSILESGYGRQPKEPVDEGKNPAAVALG